MQVTVNDFIKSPALYISKVTNSAVTIVENGQPVAVLVKPDSTPISDSLVGLLKNSGVKNKDDIKSMRAGQ